MTKITHAQLSKLAKTYYKTKTPLFVWGTIGIGKSTIIKEVAQAIAHEEKLGFIEGEPNGKEKFGFIDVRISQLEPSDLRGLPNIDISGKTEQKTTKWIIPNWLPQDKESKGILFFDELNLAPPSIQASCYQLILDRRLGDYELPSGWIIISAGNTINDKANVFDLPSPLANRFAHLELNIPSKDEWVKWGLNNNIDNSIISFLEFKPSHLFKFERDNKEKAFPTPRSWEFCSKLIKESQDLSKEEQNLLICSAIGEGVGIEFNAFLRLQNKINIKDILEKPESVKEIKEIDLKYSLVSLIVDKQKQDTKIFEKVLNICDNLEPEFAILLLRFLSTSKRNFKKEILKSKTGNKIIDKYGKYLIDLKEIDN